MLSLIHKKRAGFTLVEIMIVVAIIALLAAIAVPNFLRARKRSQATRILEDLRILDSAIDQYASERNISPTTSLNFADIKYFIKDGTALYSGTGADIFGRAYTITNPSTPPKLSSSTFDELSDVAPQEFWSPYNP